nr:unnamed protein product [Callosobruchus chinensis]
MSVLDLARQLNAVEIICVERELRTRTALQPFDYIFVLDFEATCWDRFDRDRGYSEVIEFPCVIYDVKKGNIVSEFQQYVMPIENPRLTAFCTQLTGINQKQVDNGCPLGTCLMLFRQWINHQKTKLGLTLEGPHSNCTFATWSDWDLGVCLKNECRRKQIMFPTFFENWMDVRYLYREFYQRRPKGLYGALNELGLEFTGRQHCGLDDARNTAKLIGRMVADGILLKNTTKS